MLSAIIKPMVDLCRKGFAAWKKRRNPAHAQAQRLLDAFAAHGVAGVQIPRLLPEALALPNAVFADPDELKKELTPRLLDWVADTLALRRSWLDGVDSQRHHRVQGYKQPSIYRDWLQQRQAFFPHVDRIIHVFVASKEPLGPQSTGPLCVAYGERFDMLDTQELSRYWLLSDHWRLDHPPCTVNLMALCAIATDLDIMVIGHVVKQEALTRLDDGQLFVPQALALDTHRWFPSDLIDPPLGQDSEWRQALRSDAQTMLASSKTLKTYADQGEIG
jgi:hypothetical protein